RQAPMAADDALQEAFVRKAVEAAVFAVALAGGEHEREIARGAGLQEALFERGKERVGRADADEAGGDERVAGFDDLDGFLGGDEPVFHDAHPPSSAEEALPLPLEGRG